MYAYSKHRVLLMLYAVYILCATALMVNPRKGRGVTRQIHQSGKNECPLTANDTGCPVARAHIPVNSCTAVILQPLIYNSPSRLNVQETY